MGLIFSNAHDRYNDFISFLMELSPRATLHPNFFVTVAMIKTRFPSWTAQHMTEVLKQATGDNVVAPVQLKTAADMPPVPEAGYITQDLYDVMLGIRNGAFVKDNIQAVSAFDQLLSMADTIIAQRQAGNEPERAGERLSAGITRAAKETASGKRELAVLSKPFQTAIHQAMTRMKNREQEFMERVSFWEGINVLQGDYSAYQILGPQRLFEAKQERDQKKKEAGDRVRTFGLGVVGLAAAVGFYFLVLWIVSWISAHNQQSAIDNKATCLRYLAAYEASTDPVERKELLIKYGAVDVSYRVPGRLSCAADYQTKMLP